jgi:hypothetical protein
MKILKQRKHMLTLCLSDVIMIRKPRLIVSDDKNVQLKNTGS